MLHTINWQQAIHDPRFWAIRYNCDGRYRRFPGVTGQESLAWYKSVMEDDLVNEKVDTEEMEEGWMLSLSFPEGFIWQIGYTTEDEMDSGTDHILFHLDLPPQGIYLAAEGPDDHLPGLRWAELKQIMKCLIQHWQGNFDVRAIVPLLYPVVEYITIDEVVEVRQMLATAWQDLHVLEKRQAEQFLDEIIEVYDQGQILRIDTQDKWIPVYNNSHVKKESLWVKTEQGWKTNSPRSERNVGKDCRYFLPFFSMLERYS